MDQKEAFEAWWKGNPPAGWHTDWYLQLMKDLAHGAWHASIQVTRASKRQPKQEEAAHDAIELAAMIMSDCGISTINSSRLQAKIAARIAMYAAQVESD